MLFCAIQKLPTIPAFHPHRITQPHPPSHYTIPGISLDSVKIIDDGGYAGVNVNTYTNENTSASTTALATDFLDVSVTLSTTAAQTLGTVAGSGAASFAITGGGANFQLASKVDIAGQVSIGLQDIAARKLGNTSAGFLNSLASGKANNVVDGDIADAQKVIGEAIKQVSGLRGRVGAFQKNTVGATIRSLGDKIENTAAAQSVIRDADFASETANLTHSQILISASTNILSIANSAPQSALQLLG